MTLEPIVLIGGFGSHWSDYRQFARALANVSGRRVFIAGINRLSWLVGGLLTDYTLLVNRTHHAVTHALQITNAPKVILVGHSAGGVVGRGYLGDRMIKRHHVAYRGFERVKRFVALASPLRAVEGPKHIGLEQAAWLDKEYPGAYFSPDVQYQTVSGRFIEGKLGGTPAELLAYRNYEFVSGRGDQWGDGVVPLTVSTLEGVPSLEIDGLAHSPQWGRWFGSDEASVRMWWDYFDLGDAPSLNRKEFLV